MPLVGNDKKTFMQINLHVVPSNFSPTKNKQTKTLDGREELRGKKRKEAAE